jgi:hypothetical protein
MVRHTRSNWCVCLIRVSECLVLIKAIPVPVKHFGQADRLCIRTIRSTVLCILVWHMLLHSYSLLVRELCIYYSYLNDTDTLCVSMLRLLTQAVCHSTRTGYLVYMYARAMPHVSCYIVICLHIHCDSVVYVCLSEIHTCVTYCYAKIAICMYSVHA